jgi:hypothetical protein
MRLALGTGLVYATSAVLALACSQQAPQSQADADEELTSLVERADRLRDRLAAGDPSSSELRAEFEQLRDDARAWRDRTGRTEVRIGTDSIQGTEPGAIARDDDEDDADDPCTDCPGYELRGDRICLLRGQTDCEPGDVIWGRLCVYDCIWIGSGRDPRGREVKE